MGSCLLLGAERGHLPQTQFLGTEVSSCPAPLSWGCLGQAMEWLMEGPSLLCSRVVQATFTPLS